MSLTRSREVSRERIAEQPVNSAKAYDAKKRHFFIILQPHHCTVVYIPTNTLVYCHDMTRFLSFTYLGIDKVWFFVFTLQIRVHPCYFLLCICRCGANFQITTSGQSFMLTGWQPSLIGAEPIKLVDVIWCEEWFWITSKMHTYHRCIRCILAPSLLM